MTEQEALVRAIIAEPASDTLRLIYADWLDEHDQPERAEFIRVQVEMAQPMPDCDWREEYGQSCPQYNHARVKTYRVQIFCPSCSRRESLRRREQELWTNRSSWSRDGNSWLTGEPQRSHGPYVTISEDDFNTPWPWRHGDATATLLVHRGFPCKFRGDWDSWLRDERLFASVQPIERVMLTDRPGLSSMRHGYTAERIGEIERLLIDGLPLEDAWKNIIFPEHWPSITFTMPASEGWTFGDDAAFNDAAFERLGATNWRATWAGP